MSTSRTIELNYQVDLPEPKDQGDPIHIWLPLPAATPHQDVLAMQSDASMPVEICYDPVFGNPILHGMTQGDGAGVHHIGYRAVIERKEWHVDLTQQRPARLQQDAQLLRHQLSQTSKIKFLPELLEVAQTIRAKHQKAIDIARAVYDHVLASMSYDKSVEGWGQGDTEWACSMGKGNCTDFHTLFLALLRCCGIAGEFEIGAAFPADMKDGDITHFKCGYHCWTRFYDPALGWIPVDVSEASRHPEKRDYFFGTIDQDRVLLSRGRDILMVPHSQGGLENFFTEPRLERVSGSSVMYDKKLEFSSL
ncbi:MAG: hypothetical protein RL748_2848 [Pseudomonadota bacterium]